MAASIELTREYGYVVLVLVAYSFLNLWMGLQVGKARRKYKVSYPTMYAVESENKDAKLFNCVQVRAPAHPKILPPPPPLTLGSISLWRRWREQRGHQNSLEVMPLFFAMLLLGGLRHPAAAAGLGALYTVARLFYFTGYATGVPRNRMRIGYVVRLIVSIGS
jgi:glutathione S-transferase